MVGQLSLHGISAATYYYFARRGNATCLPRRGSLRLDQLPRKANDDSFGDCARSMLGATWRCNDRANQRRSGRRHALTRSGTQTVDRSFGPGTLNAHGRNAVTATSMPNGPGLASSSTGIATQHTVRDFTGRSWWRGDHS